MVYFLIVIIFLISQLSKVIKAISLKKIKTIKAIKNIVAIIKVLNFTIKAILIIYSKLRLLLNSFYKLRKKSRRTIKYVKFVEFEN